MPDLTEQAITSHRTAVSTGTTPENSWPLGLRKIRDILGFLVLLAVATSFLYLRYFHNYYENADSPGYIAPAVNLLAGHGFADARGNADTLRTPGYPLLILLFLWAHFDLKYLVIFQHLLRVLIVLATAAFAFRLTGSRRQSLLAGILLCIDLPMLKSANDVLTEIPFTAVLSVVLALLWRESKQTKPPGLPSFISGLLAGASVLIRPVGLFFFVPAAAYLLLVRRTYKFRVALIFVMSFICIPMLWAIRNYRQAGYFTVSSISGYSVLQCRAAGVLAINDPGDFYVNLERRQYELDALACQDWSRVHGRDCSQMTIPEQSQYYSKYGSRIVLQHPLAYLKLAGRGVAMTMLTGSPASLSGLTGMSFALAAKVLLIYTVPAFCFALFGLKEFWTINRAFFWLAALVCVYFVGISAGAESFSRFRVPIIPVYGILIALGVDSFLQKIPAWKGGKPQESHELRRLTN
jgi:hypothetical protein